MPLASLYSYATFAAKTTVIFPLQGHNHTVVYIANVNGPLEYMWLEMRHWFKNGRAVRDTYTLHEVSWFQGK
jgi:hypothetical protein